MGSYSALTTLTNTITTMFRAICFAAVIATGLSQNFRNFNKDSRFSPKPVSKSLLSITNILSKFPIGQFASTDNANENDSIFQIQNSLVSQCQDLSSPAQISYLTTPLASEDFYLQTITMSKTTFLRKLVSKQTR